MRTSWWACVATCMVAGAVTCSVGYSHFNRPSPQTETPGVSKRSDGHSVDQKTTLPLTDKDQARLQDGDAEPADMNPAPNLDQDLADLGKVDLTYLAYYAYSEIPPDPKPADVVLDALKRIPPGTPVDEIRWVSGLLGLDFTFMKAVAKIESNFKPTSRTGSYVGLFQLGKTEFEKYGSGDILNARDNTVAAALKFINEAIMFEMFTHRKPTLNDLYLIHQQGIEGAAEHVSHPKRLAWQSMCATDEGKEKGERWCKRAIWGNTLPAVKKVWKNVDKFTSGAFVAMWQQRVTHFYALYSTTAAAN